MQAKTEVVRVRVTEAEKLDWSREAKEGGLNLSEWIRKTCNPVVMQVRLSAAEKRLVGILESEVVEVLSPKALPDPGGIGYSGGPDGGDIR